jgi:hypothetical protein
MRGAASILVVFLICLSVAALYWFIGRGQLNKEINALRGEVELLEGELREIARMEQEIPQLLGQLPSWQRQYELLRTAIPPQIDDHEFFAALTRQLDDNGVSLLSLSVSQGEQWMSGLSESQFDELRMAGLDVDVARKVMVVFYSINVMGDYGNMLRAFEGLKAHGRLYTIESVRAPAGGGGGTVMQNIDAQNTPLQMTGRLYYGIPENYFNVTAMRRLSAEMGTDVAATSIYRGVTGTGQRLLDAPLAGADGAGGGNAAGNPATQAGDGPAGAASGAGTAGDALLSSYSPAAAAAQGGQDG